MDYSTGFSVLTPSDGSRFWGVRDLNGSCGGNGFESIIFSNINIASSTNVIFAFDYYALGLDNFEDLKYELFYDNISQGEVIVVDGVNNNSDNTNGWITETVNIPNSVTNIRVTLSARSSSDFDMAGFDNVRLSGFAGNDTDGDGTFDGADIDDDNDGIIDIIEGDCAPIINNSSIETPNIAVTPPFPLITFNVGVKNYNAADVPFWETTATDNAIEIWSNTNTLSFPHINAHTGNQFMELNANQVASSYQDLATDPGTTLRWSVAHRGRSGTDNASVSIGQPGNVSIVQVMTTSNVAWRVYSGTYLVLPAKQQQDFNLMQ